ncbi:hypothetical protein CUP1603 [Campylobacter upsaliensis RM3195]|nr:hypothetical protein CUP1603 [Campylobacter upsaliensis RM3195]
MKFSILFLKNSKLIFLLHKFTIIKFYLGRENYGKSY